MVKYLLQLILLALCNPLYAQLQLTGVITDARNEERLPYVNIGIKGKNLGTVSNENGEFSIKIPAQYLNDTLTFSMVGYHELKFSIKLANSAKTFSLKPKKVNLDEVIISSRKLSEKKYGLKHNPVLHFLDASVNQNDIFEIAQLIKLGPKPSKITSVSLLINQPRNDSGTFRINFYSHDGNYPANRIVEKDIIQTHAIKQGWLHFDISNNALYLKGDVVVAIEFIPTGKRNDPVVYEIKPGGRMKSYVRTSSLGTWHVPPHQYRMFVTALGGEVNTPQDEEPEKDIEPTFRIFSKMVSDSFSIFVRLPKGYENNIQNYPVIYVLDANLYFGYVADSIEKIEGKQPLLIGVGYRDFLEMDSLRNRDYTYPLALPLDSFKISGGADKFYEFFNKELIPYIDEQYHADKSNRTIMGHSLGGYFTLYALYRNVKEGSALFKNYIAASPSIDYHDEYLIKRFSEVKTGTSKLQRTVYISWGGREDDNDGKKKYSDIMDGFVTQLSDGIVDTMQIHKKRFPFAGHMETAIPTFYHGINVGL